MPESTCVHSQFLVQSEREAAVSARPAQHRRSSDRGNGLPYGEMSSRQHATAVVPRRGILRCNARCVSALTVLVMVLEVCSTAEDGLGVAAFVPLRLFGHTQASGRIESRLVSKPNQGERGVGPMRPSKLSRAAVVQLSAQLPGQLGISRAGRTRPSAGCSLREIMRLSRGDQRYGNSRTAVRASTHFGGKTTGDDEFHYPEGTTRFVAECDLPTDRGNFRMRAYTYRGAKMVVRDGENVLEWTEMEPVIIYKGNLRGSTSAVVRVHDQCYTSEVLGSKRCDCREQLELALDYINQHGGALVYMPQEGRGIGLANKIAAYQLQDGGLDTVDANRVLGFGDDERDYACVPWMLKDMGIKGIRLMTNNPFKIRQLTELGVKIVGAKAHIVASNEFNAKYLRTKAARMAHALPHLDTADTDVAPGALAADSAAAERGVGSKGAVAEGDVRWRFGKKSVEEAAKAILAGAGVVVVDGSQNNQGWLVAAAAGIPTITLSLVNQLGDAISVSVADGAVEAMEANCGDCWETYHSRGSDFDSNGVDAVDCQEGGAGRVGLLDGRASFLRRLATASDTASRAKVAELLSVLPSPLAAVLGAQGEDDSWQELGGRGDEALLQRGCEAAVTWGTLEQDCLARRLLPVRAKPAELLTRVRSPYDAAVALVQAARLAPVAVVSPVLTPDRLDVMSFAEVMAVRQTLHSMRRSLRCL